MPEHRIQSAIGPALVTAGFSPAAAAGDQILYAAEVAVGSGAVRDVLLSLSADTLLLRTFLAAAHLVSYGRVRRARSPRDGYAQDEFDGSWVLTERPSDYLNAEFPNWDGGASAQLVDAAVDFVVAKTVGLARYGAAVADRLSTTAHVVVPLTASPELTVR